MMSSIIFYRRRREGGNWWLIKLDDSVAASVERLSSNTSIKGDDRNCNKSRDYRRISLLSIFYIIMTGYNGIITMTMMIF